MSVLDNIMIGRHHLMKAGFVRGMVYWIGGAQTEEAHHRAAVEEIIDFLEIQDIRNEHAGTLSYGLRKRVELARAIALKPEVILLDEPMAGMNLEEKEDMARYIVDLNEELGMTVVMIEHDMGVVMDLSHRLMVLDFGRKIAEGLPEEIKANEDVKRAYLGQDHGVVGASRKRRRWHDSGAFRPRRDQRHPAEAAALQRSASRRRHRAAREGIRPLAHAHLERIPRSRQAVGTRPCAIWASQPGDAVAIIGDSRPDWVAAAVGAHALQRLSLGIYQDALDAEVGYLLNFADAKVVVAENEEQVDKILRAAGDGSPLIAIVYCDPRGMRKYDDPRIVGRDAILEQARQTAAAEPGLWDALVDATSGDDIAVLCSTSGTTTNPKLVSISVRPVHPSRRHLLQSGRSRPRRRVRLDPADGAGWSSSSRRCISRWSAVTNSTSSRAR